MSLQCVIEQWHKPFSSTAKTLAPFPSSSWTTTVSPLLAAMCSGLHRNRDKRLTAHPVGAQQHLVLKYIRLKSSIRAVDQVPVADFLQDQQGTRFMTLKEAEHDRR